MYIAPTAHGVAVTCVTEESSGEGGIGGTPSLRDSWLFQGWVTPTLKRGADVHCAYGACVRGDVRYRGKFRGGRDWWCTVPTGLLVVPGLGYPHAEARG